MTPVSVIIPWYRNIPDLDRAIESVMVQSHTDFEIIVVVNGVPETVCAEIEARHDTSRIRVLYSGKPDASLARNHGAVHATGDLIFFLDADDIFRPDKLATFVALYETKPFDLAFSRGLRLRGNDVAWAFPKEAWDGGEDISEFFFCRGNTISASAIVMAASARDRIGFNPKYRSYEDPELVIDAVNAGLRVTMLPEILFDWNDERTGNRLSQLPNHDERIAWVGSMEGRMTDKAIHAFKARCIAQHMLPKRAGEGISMIVKAALARAITPLEAVLFLVRGLLPAGLRRGLVNRYFLRRTATIGPS